MKNQKGQSKLDTVLKMLLIAFISLLAFSSGVYFGHEMSLSQHSLKALEADFNHGKSDSGKHAEGHGDAMADEDVDAIANKYVNSEKDKLTDEEPVAAHAGPAPASVKEGHDEEPVAEKASAHQPVAPATHAAKNAHEEEEPVAPKGHDSAAASTFKNHDAKNEDVKPIKAERKLANAPDHSQVFKAAQRVASDVAPTAAPAATKESRQPTSLPMQVGPAAGFPYTVQIASYPTVADAKSHIDELIKKGYPAYTVEAAVKGKTWYRVSIGSFKSMKEATDYRGQIMKQGDLQTAIVQKIER